MSHRPSHDKPVRSPMELPPCHTESDRSSQPGDLGDDAMLCHLERTSRLLEEELERPNAMSGAMTLPITAPESPVVNHSEEDERSIREYMERLLQRNSNPPPPRGGAAPAPAVPARGSSVTLSANAVLEAVPAGCAVVAAEPAAPQAPRTPGSLATRAADPPVIDKDCLQSMRHLANLNARQSLDTHSCRQLRQAGHDMSLRAAWASATSLLLVALTHLWPTLHPAAVVMWLASAAWTVQFLSLSRQLAETHRIATASAATDEDADRQQPTDAGAPASG